MTLSEAEKLVQRYGSAMAAGVIEGTRRDPRLLPAPPNRILIAVKICLAFLIQRRSHTERNVEPLIATASMIDSFRNTQQSPVEFAAAMQARRAELDEFFAAVLKLDPEDPHFWQRIHAQLADVSEFQGANNNLASRSTAYATGVEPACNRP